jgi:hypothetical protein
MRFLVEKIRPGRGFSHAFHLLFLAILPVVLFVLVRLEFNLVALIVLLLSKWRMLALHPRHWIAHLRTNAVDIIVGLSFLAFIINSPSLILQLVWVVLFEVWLLAVKPRTEASAVAVQALIALGLGLSSIFYANDDASIAFLVIGFWLVAYFCARHFFNAYEEHRSRLLSAIWGFFAASLVWVLSHWLLFIGPIAQPALIVAGIGYGLAAMYHLEKSKQLTSAVRRQIILTLIIFVFLVIVFSDWGDKTV